MGVRGVWVQPFQLARLQIGKLTSCYVMWEATPGQPHQPNGTANTT